MKFGISVKNRFSGAWLSVRLFQVISILPAVYLFVSSGYRAVLQGKNIFSFLLFRTQRPSVRGNARVIRAVPHHAQ